MGRLKRMVVLLAPLLLAVSCGGGGGNGELRGTLVHPGHDGPAIDLGKPDLVRKVDAYELRVYYIAKGTRSEGAHGVLLKDGARVEAPAGDERLPTSAVALVWHGAWEQRKLLFEKSGWLPEDLTGIFPSWGEAKQP